MSKTQKRRSRSSVSTNHRHRCMKCGGSYLLASNGKGPSRLKTLIQHAAVHCTHPKFGCPSCDYQAKTSASVKRHQQEYHPTELPVKDNFRTESMQSLLIDLTKQFFPQFTDELGDYYNYRKSEDSARRREARSKRTAKNLAQICISQAITEEPLFKLISTLKPERLESSHESINMSQCGTVNEEVHENADPSHALFVHENRSPRNYQTRSQPASEVSGEDQNGLNGLQILKQEPTENWEPTKSDTTMQSSPHPSLTLLISEEDNKEFFLNEADVIIQESIDDPTIDHSISDERRLILAAKHKPFQHLASPPLTDEVQGLREENCELKLEIKELKEDLQKYKDQALEGYSMILDAQKRKNFYKKENIELKKYVEQMQKNSVVQID